MPTCKLTWQNLAAAAAIAVGAVVVPAAPAEVRAAVIDCAAQPLITNTGGPDPSDWTLRSHDPDTGEEIAAVGVGKEYGDVALTADGTLYAITLSDITLDTLDPVSGAVISSVPVTGIDEIGGVANALTSLPDGDLLVGFSGHLEVLRLDPSTGTTSPYAVLPEPASGSGGDFVSLPDGDVVAVAATEQGDSLLVRLHPDATATVVGLMPESFGAALVNGALYLAGATGTIWRLTSLPTAATLETLPTSVVADTGRQLNGATAAGDAGLCAPTITVTQRLAGARAAPDDQFTVELRAGSPTGAVVNKTGASTTSGASALVTPGTGTTGVYAASAGTTYHLRQSAAGSTDLARYRATVTCADATGRQPDLPTDAPLPAALTVVAGAAIACTITNRALAAGLDLVVRSTAPTYERAGQAIGLEYVVTNTGDVPIEGVVVTDPGVSGVTCPATVLDPGAQMVCTAGHLVTQADLDAGAYTTTASVTGAAPAGFASGPFASSTVTVPATQRPALALTVATEVTLIDRVGQPVPFTFAVTNTGNVTMTEIQVIAPRVPDVRCPGSILAPVAAMTCAGSAVVTEADLLAGRLTLGATVTGVGAGSSEATAASSAEVTVLLSPPIPPVTAPVVRELPRTGGGTVGAAALAAGLLLAGAALLTVARRRPTAG